MFRNSNHDHVNSFYLFPPVGTNVVNNVLLAAYWANARERELPKFTARSLPGHLIQAIVEGSVWEEVNGRQYTLNPGDMIWYHEDEQVHGEILTRPWNYYSINFIAPTLNPPPFERRVQRVGESTLNKFDAVVAAWCDLSVPASVRELRVHGHLLDLLSDLLTAPGESYRMDPSAQLWWELETKLRQHLDQPITLTDMQRIIGRSPATIARSCQRAVNMPPMKRVKQIRMSLARGLVHTSQLRFKEIADRVGYLRIHEFSRDYHKFFGRTPSEDRAAHRLPVR